MKIFNSKKAIREEAKRQVKKLMRKIQAEVNLEVACIPSHEIKQRLWGELAIQVLVEGAIQDLTYRPV